MAESEFKIYTIPPAYYGGAGPKIKPESRRQISGAPVPEMGQPIKKKLGKYYVFAGVGGLFLIVMGGAIWYYTRALRVPSVAPSSSAPALIPTIATPENTPLSASVPPESAAVPIPPSLEETTPPPPPGQEPFSDTDADGLTLAEEEIYRSDPTRPDTDNDGFLDGHEVVNLYNSSGIAPQRLEAAGLVKRLRQRVYGYELLFPSVWTEPKSLDGRELVFVGTDKKETIKLSVLDNPGGLAPEQWLKNEELGQEVQLWTFNKSGLLGAVIFKDAGALTGVFSGRGFLYVLRLEKNSEEQPLRYRRTFELLLNSFKITN